MCAHTHTPTQRTGDFCLRHIRYCLPTVRISFVCFTLFTAILSKSLISCIIEQPVYMSQLGCDGYVCVLLTGLVFTSLMLWLSGIKVVGHYATLK